MSQAMTKSLLFVFIVAGCALVSAAPAQAQSRQATAKTLGKTTEPAVSAKIVGAKPKARTLRHPTAAQRIPNPSALTVITLPDGSKRLRRPDKAR